MSKLLKSELYLKFRENKHIRYIALKIKRLKLSNITGKNNYISNKGIAINLKYDIIGEDNTITIGKNTFIENTTIYVRGNNHVLSIGENCMYKGGSIWLDGNNCKINIKNYTTVMSAHLCAQEYNTSIVIGEDCMLSNNIIIRTSDSHSIIDNISHKRINHAKNVEIGNHVWIAAWVRVLKGVKVEDNSILATGSFITSNVPKNVIVGGVPAKIIKSDVNWLREQIT